MQMTTDTKFRLALTRKLAEAGQYFGELVARDCNALIEARPRKEMEGFLRFSQAELLWAFDAQRPSDLDPFVREHVADLAGMHRKMHSAADLHFIAGTLAVVLRDRLGDLRRYESCDQRDEAQRKLFLLTGKTAPITFSPEEIEQMVADLAS